jgi:hypothetical protein
LPGVGCVEGFAMRSGSVSSVWSLGRRGLAVLLAVSVVVLLPSAASARASSPPAVRIDKIGEPSWKPTDVVVFAGRIGSPPGFADYLPTVLATLPQHAFHPELGVGPDPDQPHGPPYRHELDRGVEAAGYDTGRCFTPDQFSAGTGVFAAWMVVPRGRRHVGSSPDFARGPIIPNSLFPIVTDGIAYRDDEAFDPVLIDEFPLPPLDEVDPPFDVDGHSHFPFFIVTNADFAPPGTELVGRYVYDMTMIDDTGVGWSINVTFAVRTACGNRH